MSKFNSNSNFTLIAEDVYSLFLNGYYTDENPIYGLAEKITLLTESVYRANEASNLDEKSLRILASFGVEFYLREEFS